MITDSIEQIESHAFFLVETRRECSAECAAYRSPFIYYSHEGIVKSGISLCVWLAEVGEKTSGIYIVFEKRQKRNTS